MRVLFVCSEIAPWVKTGGLGDVAAALPPALAELGVEVRLLLPGYPALLAAHADRRPLDDVAGARVAPAADLPEARLSLATSGEGLTYVFIECPALFDRPGGPYQHGGVDWPDNALRFGLLSRTAAWLASHESSSNWRPDVLHCHDWQAALAPAYQRFRFDTSVPSLVTIHNLAFQGIFPRETLTTLDLPDRAFTIDGVEFHGSVSFLKAGLALATRLNTVSPGYAREILDAPHGCGLDALLRHRRDALSGILNGIDTEQWDPATDPYLPQRYTTDRMECKRANKRALQAEVGLPAMDSPLLGSVGRMTAQKGVDLMLDCAEALVARGVQLALLGSGEAEFEQRALHLAGRHPQHIAVRIGYDEGLAHRIEAGADFFLMPSRFEPCGLNQLYSQRYGTPPIVHRTGGLADTVVDATSAQLAEGCATGIVFDAPTADGLLAAIERALSLTGEQYRGLQQAGMGRDFSWHASAQRYLELYRELASLAPLGA